jgi:hypothetical protein
MTEAERNEEGAEDTVEDLEAPASAQEDVAGGEGTNCPGAASAVCANPTCRATKVLCRSKDTMTDFVVYEQ